MLLGILVFYAVSKKGELHFAAREYCRPFEPMAQCSMIERSVEGETEADSGRFALDSLKTVSSPSPLFCFYGIRALRGPPSWIRRSGCELPGWDET